MAMTVLPGFYKDFRVLGLRRLEAFGQIVFCPQSSRRKEEATVQPWMQNPEPIM